MNNELYHHGILGQKWGIRRFQNPDGSLTEEGQKRYRRKLANAYERRDIKGINKSVKSMVPDDAYSNLIRLKREYKNALNAAPGKEFLDYVDDEAFRRSEGNISKYIPKWFNEEEQIMDDIVWSEIFHNIRAEIWNEHPKEKSAEDYAEKKIDEYVSECKHIADNLIGQYGTYKVKNAYTDGEVRSLVKKAIEEIPDDSNRLINIQLGSDTWRVPANKANEYIDQYEKMHKS